MILRIPANNLAAHFGPKPWIKQQHPTANAQPVISDERERSPLAQIIGIIPNRPPSGSHTEPNREGPLLNNPSSAQTVIKTKRADISDVTYTADAFNQIGVFLLYFKLFSCFCWGERILSPRSHFTSLREAGYIRCLSLSRRLQG